MNLEVCVALSAEAVCLGIAHVNLEKVCGLSIGLVKSLLLCHLAAREVSGRAQEQEVLQVHKRPVFSGR